MFSSEIFPRPESERKTVLNLSVKASNMTEDGNYEQAGSEPCGAGMSDAHSPTGGVQILESEESRCVRIERTSATAAGQPDGVKMFVRYRRIDRFGALAALIIYAAVLVALPVAALHIVPQWKPARWFPPALALIALVPFGAVAAVQFDRTHRRYVFRADPRGLSVNSEGPFGTHSQTYPREEIGDVRLHAHQGRSGGSAGRLAIEPAHGWKPGHRYLTGLGTIMLARVADALREGLGMPPRSWS
jgi:hypothetical protein